MAVRLSVLVSATLLFIHVLTLGRQACAVQNTCNCTECAVIAACSVRTGYVFFGTLVSFCAVENV